MSYIGIDLGTSFLKGAVLDPDSLAVRHVEREPFPDLVPDLPPLHKEADPKLILERVEALLERLLAHADLETHQLFPRAGRLEQELYENTAPGLSRFPGDQ